MNKNFGSRAGKAQAALCPSAALPALLIGPARLNGPARLIGPSRLIGPAHLGGSARLNCPALSADLRAKRPGHLLQSIMHAHLCGLALQTDSVHS